MARIGFVGLGAMGAPMARNLLAKGFAVRGFDTRAAAVDELVAAGGKPAADAAAAADGAEALVLMVVNAAQAEALLDLLADALAHGIAGVSGRPTVDRRPAVGGVPGDMRRRSRYQTCTSP